MKKHFKLMLLAMLALTLCFAIGISACNITPDDGDDKGKEKIEVDFDEKHFLEEGESIESLRPYITVTYFNKNGNSTVVTDYEIEGKIFDDFYYITVNYKGHSFEFKVMIKSEHKFDEYTVTFKADGQTVSTQKYSADNKNFTVPEVPAKTGYTGEWEEYALTTGNVTVNAVYTAIEYTVTFKANDQTVDTRTYTVENKNISEPTVPDKTGYNGVWEKYTLTIGNITVNAVYTAKQYIITLDYQGATAGNTHQTLKVTYNQPVGTLPIPEKTKYEFVGWKHNNIAVTAESVWTTDGDATFVAQWLRPTEGLAYTLNSDGNSYSVSVSRSTATNTEIIISSTYEGKPVTAIGDRAFYNCSSLTSITIPDNVISIGSNAFYNCSSLTSVTIPNSVTSIGSSAFSCCSSLTSVTIPDSVTSIGYQAFYNCGNLTNINYSGTIESWCNVQGLDNLMRYGTYSKTLSINGEQVTDVVIPSSVTSIQSCAFYYCTNITSVTIPDSVTSIGGSYAYSLSAFFGCYNLANINYLGTVESWCNIEGLDNLMRYGTSSKTFSVNGEPVTELAIPSSVTSIQSCAFYYCTNITSVAFEENSQCTSIGIYAFGYCSYITSITIPNSVTSIEDTAFSGCSHLQYNEYDNALYLGNADNPYLILIKAKDTSVISCTINESTKFIHYDAFKGCNNLATVNYLGTIESWCNIQGLDNLMYVYGISSKTLSINGKPITDLAIPDTITSIPEGAFASTNITSVTIPDSITDIGYRAFSGCSSLTSITIPDSVTRIGSYAFYGCSSLTIYCEAVSKPSGWDDYGSSRWNSSCPVVWDCNNNDKDNYGYAYALIDGIRYSLKDNVATVIRQPGNIAEANIPQKVIYKGTDYSVTSIDNEAFYYRSSLISVTIPDSVICIGREAFRNCSSLTSITIPDSVTNIGDVAFYKCSSLKSVYYKGTAKDWSKISISNYNDSLISATRYYFSESEPALNADGTAYDGNYWHYDIDGKTPVIWKKQ